MKTLGARRRASALPRDRQHAVAAETRARACISCGVSRSGWGHGSPEVQETTLPQAAKQLGRRLAGDGHTATGLICADRGARVRADDAVGAIRVETFCR